MGFGGVYIPVYTLIYKKLCMAQGAIRSYFPRFGGFKFYFRQSFNDLISDFAFRAPQAKKIVFWWSKSTVNVENVILLGIYTVFEKFQKF